MPSDTVTLRMEGDIPLHEYAATVGRFDALIQSLTAEIVQAPIDWALEQLTSLPESATTTAYGRAELRDAVRRVAAGYLSVGKALATGHPIPYSLPVQYAANEMRSVLNGRVRAVVFETADDEASVSAAPTPEPEPRPKLVTRGAITGRIQTVTNRRSLRFTLFDLLYDRAVSCYLAEGREELIRDMWGKVATVEGVVTRDPASGRAASIRQIREVIPRPDAGSDDYLRARGAVPGPLLMPPEEAVRRLRDA